MSGDSSLEPKAIKGNEPTAVPNSSGTQMYAPKRGGASPQGMYGKAPKNPGNTLPYAGRRSGRGR